MLKRPIDMVQDRDGVWKPLPEPEPEPVTYLSRSEWLAAFKRATEPQVLDRRV